MDLLGPNTRKKAHQWDDLNEADQDALYEDIQYYKSKNQEGNDKEQMQTTVTPPLLNACCFGFVFFSSFHHSSLWRPIGNIPLFSI
jgi:hypothetical protein